MPLSSAVPKSEKAGLGPRTSESLPWFDSNPCLEFVASTFELWGSTGTIFVCLCLVAPVSVDRSRGSQNLRRADPLKPDCVVGGLRVGELILAG